MLKIAVLVSGGGTNLQAIIDAVKDKKINNAEIALVISNKEGAYALERAEKAGIKSKFISPKAFENRDEYAKEMIKVIKEEGCELVVLAGFLVVLPEIFIDAFERKIINIHPSLIPSFCGDGFYGLRVHEEALKRGVKVTGATVHFVDKGTDTGIGTSGNRASGLYGSQTCIIEMLYVAGSISPPGIVGDDGKGFCSFFDIFCAVFSIN